MVVIAFVIRVYVKSLKALTGGIHFSRRVLVIPFIDNVLAPEGVYAGSVGGGWDATLAFGGGV